VDSLLCGFAVLWICQRALVASGDAGVLADSGATVSRQGYTVGKSLLFFESGTHCPGFTATALVPIESG